MEAELALSVYTDSKTEQHVTDELLDLADTFEQELDDAVQLVRRKAQAMEAASDEVLGAAQRVSEDGDHVAAASHEADANAQTIAAAAQELSASIAEISSQVDRSTGAAQDATSRSQAARGIAKNLNDVSDRIGSIATLIEKIAKETRLLALNASIEAARAGEAGRGFSVVANEVKQLADQTNNATGNIRSEILSMQQAIGETVSAISDVAERVEMVNETIGAIAAAVVEQDAVTRDIAQSVGQTADSVRLVHRADRQRRDAGRSDHEGIDPASPQHVRAGRAGRQYREAGDRQPAQFPLRRAAPCGQSRRRSAGGVRRGRDPVPCGRREHFQRRRPGAAG